MRASFIVSWLCVNGRPLQKGRGQPVLTRTGKNMNSIRLLCLASNPGSSCKEVVAPVVKPLAQRICMVRTSIDLQNCTRTPVKIMTWHEPNLLLKRPSTSKLPKQAKREPPPPGNWGRHVAEGLKETPRVIKNVETLNAIKRHPIGSQTDITEAFKRHHWHQHPSTSPLWCARHWLCRSTGSSFFFLRSLLEKPAKEEEKRHLPGQARPARHFFSFHPGLRLLTMLSN